MRGSEIEEERYDVSAQPMFSHVNSLTAAAAISEVTFGEPREPPPQHQNVNDYTECAFWAWLQLYVRYRIRFWRTETSEEEEPTTFSASRDTI